MRRIAVAVFLALILSATSAGANAITEENAHRGTLDWTLPHGRSTDIEGYASLTSVAAGEPIAFYVSTAAPTYTMQVFRMGWYGGEGGRAMTSPVTLDGVKQVVPPPDSDGLVECRWTHPYVLNVPAGWVSGVYVAKISTADVSAENWIEFVVRNDGRGADLLFQSSVTTTQAYNDWGGKSLYAFNSSGSDPAVKVSFDRPYGPGVGFSEFLRWEYPTVRFLEREGYDVTYCTDIDVAAVPQLLLNRRAFLSVGHDEYWSWQMRTAVENARDAGVNLAFLSSNTCYWQIRLQADSAGSANRTMVAYKEKALSSDPIVTDGDPTNDYLTTTAWRNAPVNRPEESLKGSQFTLTTSPVDGDIVVETPGNWVFAGTGLKPGDHLTGLLGYEVDRMFDRYPGGTVRLAHSPFDNRGITDYSDMTIYRASSGAWVFGTGSMQWAWGLDDFTQTSHSQASLVSAAAQQITRNVLDTMILNGRHDGRRRAVSHE